MKPISFSIDLPVILVLLAAIALSGHGVVYQILSVDEPVWATWLVLMIYGVWILWLWSALVDLTQDRLAAAITCFAPSLIPAAVFESTAVLLVPVTLVLSISRLTFLRTRPSADLIMLAAVAICALLFAAPDLNPDAPLRERLLPLILVFPICLLGLLAGWRKPMPALCALLCLTIVGARVAGLPISLVPLLVLTPLAAAPAVVYALREIPKKQSLLLWMALPTVMYCLFWIAMMPIRPHLYPFTMTSWGG